MNDKTKSKLPDVTVGQALWFVPETGAVRTPYWIEVIKVGHTWVHLSEGAKLHRDDLRLSEFPMGQAHASKELWEVKEAATRAWLTLKKRMAALWTAPDGVTAATIRAAEMTLFGETKPKE